MTVIKPGQLVQIKGKEYPSATLDSRHVILIKTDILIYLRDFLSGDKSITGMGLYLFGDRLVVAEKSCLRRVKS